jgi:hypothetical protein
MATWSQKRKFTYAFFAALIVIGGITIPVFKIFYKVPTCSDGIQNGNELGIDCGGRCTRLCQSDFLAPNVAWTRLEPITPSLYNVAAYIINPNTEGEADNVPYHVSLYDKDGMLIIEKAGTVTLPPHRNTLAFENALNIGKRIPARASFEFTAPPVWYKQTDKLTALSIDSKDYSEDTNGSSLAVKLKNNSVLNLGTVHAFAVLYDKIGNVIGFSKTIVDEIPAGATVTAPFTWNINRKGEVISIEVLYVAE